MQITSLSTSDVKNLAFCCRWASGIVAKVGLCLDIWRGRVKCGGRGQNSKSIIYYLFIIGLSPLLAPQQSCWSNFDPPTTKSFDPGTGTFKTIQF